MKINRFYEYYLTTDKINIDLLSAIPNFQIFCLRISHSFNTPNLRQCAILNKGNNLGFDMTIKRCICRFKTLFFCIYARRQVLFSCIHKCIWRSPKLCTIKKDIKATTIHWTFYGLFSLFWDSMLWTWWLTCKLEMKYFLLKIFHLKTTNENVNHMCSTW